MVPMRLASWALVVALVVGCEVDEDPPAELVPPGVEERCRPMRAVCDPETRICSCQGWAQPGPEDAGGPA